MSKFKQGVFNPQDRKKYKGKSLPIYRSGWELKFFRWCDANSNIVAWSSESVIVPYTNPLDGKVHKYFVDGLITILENRIPKTYLIEIKPSSQVAAPVAKKHKRKSTMLYEQRIYIVNTAKWEAANKWAQQRNIEFKILTEKELKC
jgi:hypothetical protein